MWLLLIILSLILILFIIRYYWLAANLKKAIGELKKIKQNPDENRILLYSYPQKEAESLLFAMNEYILLTRRERIAFRNREKELRAQIENISHDLRTPLTAILGYLTLVEKNELSAENKEALEVIERKAKSLRALINDFYDLSRLELDDYHLQKENLDMAAFTRETLLPFYQELEDRKLTVTLTAPAFPVVIAADSHAMERIFCNMVQNALRYAESRFSVSLIAEEGIAHLLFENDTYTVKEEELEHLFERFYVSDQSRSLHGTGLGLTIGKLLAESMGGTVHAQLNGHSLTIGYRFPTI